jgi:PX domain
MKIICLPKEFEFKSKPRQKVFLNELSGEKRLKIRIHDPEIVNKGIFSQKYAVYTVSTVPFKYEVKRRYRDFEWLRNILIREYPTTYVSNVNDPKIPPMAEKTNRNLDKDYLNKRAETLQQFIDQVIESETLRSSLQLLSFLKVTDGSTWLKVKEQFDKAIIPTSVE